MVLYDRVSLYDDYEMNGACGEYLEIDWRYSLCFSWYYERESGCAYCNSRILMDEAESNEMVCVQFYHQNSNIR
jgi:DNA-directed RNA polymerase subunit RPC12/RpoP